MAALKEGKMVKNTPSSTVSSSSYCSGRGSSSSNCSGRGSSSRSTVILMVAAVINSGAVTALKDGQDGNEYATTSSTSRRGNVITRKNIVIAAQAVTLLLLLLVLLLLLPSLLVVDKCNDSCVWYPLGVSTSRCLHLRCHHLIRAHPSIGNPH